jgi:hypothetical protein
MYTTIKTLKGNIRTVGLKLKRTVTAYNVVRSLSKSESDECTIIADAVQYIVEV